jgi:transposase
MIVIGADTHKRSHTLAAVSEATGRALGDVTVAATRRSFGQLLRWARGVGGERVWALEDCRHVSGSLERFLLARGERVVRVPPKLMAGARDSAREPGKSDRIDAVAVARAAIREGVETLPVAQLAGAELDIRLLVDHRERLVKQRTALINDLRWQLHDLWPELEIPLRALTGPRWQQRLAGRLQRTEQSTRVRVARDELKRIRELTRAITTLEQELAALVATFAPRLAADPGCGTLTAAKLIGEIAGVGRFASDAKLARLSAAAPIPASSGRTDRHRLDSGGNRQLNCALYRLALNKARHDPETQAFLDRKQAEGKTRREALRAPRATSSAASTGSCNRQPATPQGAHPIYLARRHDHRLPQPLQPPQLDIGATKAKVARGAGTHCRVLSMTEAPPGPLVSTSRLVRSKSSCSPMRSSNVNWVSSTPTSRSSSVVWQTKSGGSLGGRSTDLNGSGWPPATKSRRNRSICRSSFWRRCSSSEPMSVAYITGHSNPSANA